MNPVVYVLPLIVGLCGVLQGGLNKRLAAEWGLGWVLMSTSVLVLLFSGVLLALDVYPGKMNFSELKWWHALPGVFGFLVVLCIPISIARIGALPSFLIVVASQIVASGAWDKFVEGAELPWTRVAGASLALVGAWLATL
ncbi:MAG: DMT family transporter [Bdellovibrionota bacterium]